MDNISDALQELIAGLTRTLSWLPSWVIGLALLTIAVLLALALHGALMRLLRRTLGSRHPHIRLLLEHTRGPLRLALIIFAVSIALGPAPLSPALTADLRHGLLVAFIILVGWSSLTAIQVMSEIYLSRYRIDVEDNLLARKHYTQVRILRRAIKVLIIILTAALALMTFESVRPYGVSLFASAGAAGLVVGLAAQPVLSNLIAGVQLAITQPIRIDDVVIVEGEWGRIEEITGTYVVVRIWDLRRLIVPLSHFIQQPFENWTREGSAILGAALFYLDHRAPIDALRTEFEKIVRASPHWNGETLVMQVTDIREWVIEVRALVSAQNSGSAFNLRCEIREKMLAFLRDHHPEALPRHRAALTEEEISPRPQIDAP